MKRTIVLFFVGFILFSDTSYAFTIIENTNPSAFTNPYYDASRNRYISTWDKAVVKSNTLTSYSDSSYSVARTRKTFDGQDDPRWKDFAFGCNTFYKMESFDGSGKLIGVLRFEATQIINPDPNACASGNSENPEDPPEVEMPAPCDACAIFECPGWDMHLQKLGEIKNAIPPAPNWNQVSQTFSDAIVPRLVSESRAMLSDLLGQAPAPPPMLPDLPPLDDHNFESKKPDMPEVPGLKGFTENEVKSGAPVIPFEEDPTGGFNLTVDPVNNLPDVVPGGDPGIYKRDPKELPAEYPGKPKEAEIDMGGAPTPKDGGGSPPTPGDSGGTPPKPGDGVSLPIKPDDVGLPSKENYMPKPGGG